MKALTSTLDIVACMNHPKLFQQWFPGDSWDGWRAILKAVYALPMTDKEIAFFKSVAGGRDPPRQRVKEFWCIVGRRGGKDSIASLIVAFEAAFFTGQKKLRYGERAHCLLLACDRIQSGIVAGYIKSYFTVIPPFQALIERETQDGIELSNAVTITIATNSYRSTRGFAVLNGTLDECAYYWDETTSRSDIATYNAMKPGTATVDGMIVGISTPYKTSGLLYEKWRKFFGKDDPNVLVIQSPSRTLNPTLPAEVVEQALAEDPVAAAAEWNAEWRSDIAGFVTPELLDACTDKNVTVRPPLPGLRYMSYADPASGSGKDSFTCCLAHAEGDRPLLDVAHEIRPPFSPTQAIEQIAALLKSYRVSTVHGDRYAPGFVTEGFARCGIKYVFSEFDRSEVYLECLPLLTSGRARLLDVKRMLSQFASLERRTLPTGKDRVDHPRGDRHHDDLANAAAGALALAGARNKTLVITKEHVAMVAARGPYRGSAASSLESRMGERAFARLRGRRF